MSGRQDDNSFPSFSRRPDGDRDSISSMREQMDRDREAFFTDRPTQGRPWPPLFQNAHPFDSNLPATDSLASAFRSPRFSMGNFPGESETANNMNSNNTNRPWSNYQQQNRNNSDASTHFPDNNDKSKPPSTRSTSINNPESIPIRVVYSKPKNKYTSDGRNTTDLPVRGSSNFDPALDDTPGRTGSSPRLERAHSEPPKTFIQKLRSAGPTTGVGGWVVPGTIPENAESFDGQSSHMSNRIPQHQKQHYNLSAPHNNLATSASAPSVPSQQNRPSTAPPVAPPRRSVPSRVNMNNENQAEEETPAVRHIPIFVEGRDEPVFNKKLSNLETNPRKMSDGNGTGNISRDDENRGIRKPSDFYPTGLKKVARGATNPPRLDVNQRIPQEPTSPLSPPTGPIPMGYDPQANLQPNLEPTSPQPPPPGPIPMSCSPNLMQQSVKEEDPSHGNYNQGQQTSKDDIGAPSTQESSNIHSRENDDRASRKASEETIVGEGVHVVPISLDSYDTPDCTKVPPSEEKEDRKHVDPALEKLQKVKDAVADIVEKIASFKGSKGDKEYLYLDEMLTRHMLSLDCIESGGRDDIRQIRKDTIRSINRCLSCLEARATGKQEPSFNKDADDNNAIIDALASQSNTEDK